MSAEKQLQIVQGQRACKAIQWSGGGQLPAELTGDFTNEAAAQRAIDAFKAKVRQKAIDNTPKVRTKPVKEEKSSNKKK